MTSSDRSVLANALAVVAAAMLATWSGNASAQSAADIESARQAYNEAMALRDRGDLTGALAKFKAAHALGNTPITGLDLCKTHASLGQPVEAREACLSVGRVPATAAETPRSKDARVEAARIAEEQRARIATVRVVLAGVPAGQTASLVVDGVPVPPAAASEPRSVNPGRHDIAARVGSGPESRAAIDLAPGERKDITLMVEAPAHPAAGAPPVAAPAPGPAAPYGPAPAPPPRESGSRLSPLVVPGTALFVVGTVAGSVMGLSAMSAKKDLDASCTNNICGRADHQALADAKSKADWATAGFVIGGVGATLAIAGLLFPPRASAHAAPTRRILPAITHQSIGLHGTY